MAKKQEDRTYKIETAKVGGMRLVSAKPIPTALRNESFENAREIILKLIETIKKL